MIKQISLYGSAHMSFNDFPVCSDQGTLPYVIFYSTFTKDKNSHL